MMRIPGIIPAGKKIDNLIEFVDVAPTITEILGYGWQEWMQGKSLLSLSQGKTTEHKDAVFCQGGVEREATLNPAPAKTPKQKVVHDFPDAMIRSKMIRKGDFKYIYRLAGDHELYNLKDDPEEFNNLINDPKYKNTLIEMKDRMLRFTIEYETNYPLIGKLGC
jgi:arylsulfatase A-like enzyme